MSIRPAELQRVAQQTIAAVISKAGTGTARVDNLGEMEGVANAVHLTLASVGIDLHSFSRDLHKAWEGKSDDPLKAIPKMRARLKSILASKPAELGLEAYREEVIRPLQSLFSTLSDLHRAQGSSKFSVQLQRQKYNAEWCVDAAVEAAMEYLPDATLDELKASRPLARERNFFVNPIVRRLNEAIEKTIKQRNQSRLNATLSQASGFVDRLER